MKKLNRKTVHGVLLPFFVLCMLMLQHAAFAQDRAEFDPILHSQVHKNSIWDNKPWPVSRFSFRAGGFWAINSTKLGAGTDQNPYSILNLENGLGMNVHTSSFLLDFETHLGRHHRIDLGYYNINRRATKVIDKEIHFGDHDYPVHSDIESYFRTNVFRLSYGYAFISNSRWEVGALLGFHIMDFKSGLSVNGNNQQNTMSDDVNFTVPLPDLGFWATYAFHRNWAVTAELSCFYVNVKDYYVKGDIINSRFLAQYRLSKHWEVAAGYSFFDIGVKLDRPHLKAEFDWHYNGPTAVIVYKFGS